MQDLRKIVNSNSRLWIKWDRVSRLENNVVKLYNVEFFGPVMKDCAPIDSAGFINLDFTNHYILLLNRPYIIKASWSELVSQDTERAKLKWLALEDQGFGFLHKIRAADRILVDCSGHTVEAEERKQYKLAYTAMLYNEHLSPYEFVSKE